MAAATPLKRPVKVGLLMRRRLRELNRTPRELAAAVQVSETYIADLLTGRRRPPAPGRTDVYDRMTKFLRLHRNDLPTCARAERESLGARRRRLHPTVRRALLELCEPAKARALARRLPRASGAALEQLIAGRLLEVAQGFVRRQLDDEVGIRVAATREGCDYLDVRMRLLEFLDATSDALTLELYEDFVRPRVASWDLDLATHAMRIVLRSQEPAPRQKRALAI
jgi:helix-turn-helix protein